jgi:hypothetical protein
MIHNKISRRFSAFFPFYILNRKKRRGQNAEKTVGNNTFFTRKKYDHYALLEKNTIFLGKPFEEK